jgi:hypothetical protein
LAPQSSHNPIGINRDEFAADCLLQRRVCEPSVPLCGGVALLGHSNAFRRPGDQHKLRTGVVADPEIAADIEVHDRMPAIIAPADYQRWLTGAELTAKKLLIPYIGAMTIARVSDRVNDLKQDDAALIAPLSA